MTELNGYMTFVLLILMYDPPYKLFSVLHLFHSVLRVTTNIKLRIVNITWQVLVIWTSANVAKTWFAILPRKAEKLRAIMKCILEKVSAERYFGFMYLNKSRF